MGTGQAVSVVRRLFHKNLIFCGVYSIKTLVFLKKYKDRVILGSKSKKNLCKSSIFYLQWEEKLKIIGKKLLFFCLLLTATVILGVTLYCLSLTNRIFWRLWRLILQFRQFKNQGVTLNGRHYFPQTSFFDENHLENL